MLSDKRWKIFVDRGGTFTDLVAITPDQQIVTYKLLSENPSHYQDAIVEGIRKILGLAINETIPTEQIEVIKIGTTVGTNALLERKGDRTVLLITKGFKDALRIGYQNRPDIFARQIILPDLIYENVVEVEERFDAQGRELITVNPTQVEKDLQAIYAQGIRSCAIVFMHSYCYPQHEQEVANIAKVIGFTQISISHQVSPLMKLISRGDTTVVDAYISPILRRYVNQVSQQLNRPNQTPIRLMFMQSNGGLTDADHFQGKDSLLSGPAGGIVGAVKTSLKAGFEQIITFDMGGTSTDVAHFKGEYERQFETEIAGVRIRVPMMAIHTVAAGGSSVLHFTHQRFQVGPDSSGANPGPASYRQGGPLCLTDANIILGKIRASYFPQVFGKTANLALDTDIVAQKFIQLCTEIQYQLGKTFMPEQIAAGFVEIAVENMANAIKKISIQRGYDTTEYTLVCFGGAGGQHACLIAEKLNIKTIFIHPFSGVLSAYGIGLADLRVMKQCSIEQPLAATSLHPLKTAIATLTNQATQAFNTASASDYLMSVQLQLKYQGSDSTLLVNFEENIDKMRDTFEQEQRSRYGFTQPNRAIMIDSVVVEVIQVTDIPEEPTFQRTRLTPPEAIEQTPMFSQNQWHETPIFLQESLQPEDQIVGPAIIIEKIGTIIVEPQWMARVTDNNSLVLTYLKTNSAMLGTVID